MALNFNVDPYFDDFDPSKNFHRILFKPGFAVQARELTQSQTILQSQISKFADNIFSQNTPVNGGKVTTNLSCYYVKLNTQQNNINIVASDFKNKIIQDSTGTILAKVIATAEATGTVGGVGDLPTLIVNYISGVRFTDNMTIFTSDNSATATTIGVTNGTTCTGYSSVASISEGVFYVRNGFYKSPTQNDDGTYSKYSIGNFVSVQPQTTILDKYSNKPSYRIGLTISETVVDYINDTSLLDPAVGASNYQAPGADRYQINLILTRLPLEIGNDDQFIELVRVNAGSIVKQVDSTVYSTIDDYFAKRDYETNGDYIVNEFKLTPSTNTINSSVYDLQVGKGLAYVHGYRIENQSDYVITNDRARSTNSILNNSIFIDYGSYFYVSNLNGTFDVTTMPQVDLHCVISSNINSTNTTTYNSTLAGSGLIRNLEYVSSSSSNTATYVYKAYVSDINTNALSNTAVSGTTTTITFPSNAIYSNIDNAYFGTTITVNTSGTVDTRRIVSYNGATRVATVSPAFTVSPTSSSIFTLKFPIGSIDTIVYRNSSNVIVATSSIDNSSRQNGISTGDTILQNPSGPELIFSIGFPYIANVTNSTYVSSKVYRSKAFTSISGSSQLQLTIPSSTTYTFLGSSGALSSDVIRQNYIVIDKSNGKILDFVSSGNTVSLTSDKKTVTFTSSTYSNPTVDVITNISVSNADNLTNVLKIKNLIKGNTSVVNYAGTNVNTNFYIDLNNGQTYIKQASIGKTISLYVSDVKRIVKIIDTKNPNVVPTTAMLLNSSYDVTNLFTLDNGQRDNYYNHAAVKLISGADNPKGNLLVIYDYYSHLGGDGYFDVNSYLSPNSSSPENYQEIQSYISSAGITYNLRDSIDFRPSRKNAQANFVFEYTGTPSVDDTGIMIPKNLNNYVSDYSYYLGRKDKLVLTKDRSFKIVKGTPSTSPSYPTEPDGSLVIANLNHDPYTAYIPSETPSGRSTNLSVEKILHKNWIKQDITDLQTRLNNLEYYSSLSLLESNAQSLQVPDVNGLNRFKNGILVDDFSSYSTADTFNSDFAAKINVRTKELTPLTIVDNYQLQNPTVLSSLGTIKGTNTYAVSSVSGTHTNIFTLPYTSANAVVQELASSTVSLNPFGVSVYEGVARLNPPMDNWVDNKQAPDILVTDPSIKIYQQTGGVNILNAGDFATIPGTTKTTTSSTTTTQGNQTITDTTTTTYGSQLQNITATGYSQLSSTIGVNNGYLTNIAVLPYIRPQQIVFRTKGLLVNCPVSTWFDGKDVSQYITTPNTIELTNVSGTFKEDDIIGYYFTNRFYPIARVVSLYKYPNSTSVRLYTSNLLGTSNFIPVTTFQNATFDSNGIYSGSTASGTISLTSVPISTSGVISGVGGSYTANNISNLQIYKVNNSHDWGSFLNQYGVWGNLNHTATYSASFIYSPPSIGTYTVQCSSTGTATVTANGTTIATSSSPTTVTSTTFNVTNLNNGTLAWSVTGSNLGSSGFALVIKDPSGTIVFQSSSPPNLNYDSVKQELVLPKGGAWFTGVTKLRLDQNSSSVANYYVGAKINITSKFLQEYIVQTATYVPPPPAKSGGGGGCGCFTPDTIVKTSEGEKKIIDIKVGDKVLNWNETSYNTVTMIESILDTKLKGLYAPQKGDKCFATINHPLYINGELSSIDSEKIYEMYPWLGKTVQIKPHKVIEAEDKMVYNLWTDGDGTYTVNGYGTTSIIGDGGVLRLCVDRNIFTPEFASELIVKFTEYDMNTTYGAYLINNLFGKLDIKLVNMLLVRTFKDDKNPITQKIMLGLFKFVGKIACLINNK
jgi:hypothetical protein